MHAPDARRALRIVGVAFVLYLAFLLPWRHATTVYNALLAPPADLVAGAVDDAVAVTAAGPDLRYVRVFDEARTPARDDLTTSPVLFTWMSQLFGPLHRAMYAHTLPGGAAARSTPVVQLVATFRMTLELPLFLALLLAVPRVPWRRRLKALGIGLLVLVPIHVFLAATTGFWLSDAAGHLKPAADGAVELAGPEFWLNVIDRYQYVGPVVAFALFLTLLFFGLLQPEPEPAAPTAQDRSRPAPPAPQPPPAAPPAADPEPPSRA